MLNEAHTNDANILTQMLKSGSAESGYIPIWGLAYRLKAKKFTVSPGYSSVMDTEWNGVIDTSQGIFKLIFGTLSVMYPVYLCFWNPFPISDADVNTPFGWAVWLLDSLTVRMDHAAMFPNHNIKKPGYFELCLARTTHFFNAPITTFLIEVSAYMILVLLHTYSSIAPAQSWTQSWGLLTGYV